MILSPKTYNSLKRCDANIAQALTFIRGYPFHCMAIKKVNDNTLDFFDDYVEHVNVDGIFKAEAVGFACALIKVELLNKIRPPYFVTGTQSTEDVYFCLKLRQKRGDRLKIVVDTKVPTAHLLHPETISKHNLQRMKEFHEPIFKPVFDRGQEYLAECKTQMNVA